VADSNSEVRTNYFDETNNVHPNTELQRELAEDIDEGYDMTNFTEPQGDLEAIDAQRS
jgi:hypothetical protein